MHCSFRLGSFQRFRFFIHQIVHKFQFYRYMIGKFSEIAVHGKPFPAVPLQDLKGGVSHHPPPGVQIQGPVGRSLEIMGPDKEPRILHPQLFIAVPRSRALQLSGKERCLGGNKRY